MYRIAVIMLTVFTMLAERRYPEKYNNLKEKKNYYYENEQNLINHEALHEHVSSQQQHAFVSFYRRW